LAAAGIAIVVPLDPDLRIGLFLCAALPTTISSCVILTAAAHGNSSASLLNAFWGNLIGVFASPLILRLLHPASETANPINLLPILERLSVVVVFPLLMGIVLGSRKKAPEGWNRGVGASVALFLVYSSLSRLFIQNIPWLEIPSALLAVTLLLLLLHGATYVAGHLLKLDAPERAALLFTGSQKTLLLGTPIALLILPNSGPLVLLPLILYHHAQLLLGFLLAGTRLRRLL
jgi:sodium/bile acid cotransporter 7